MPITSQNSFNKSYKPIDVFQRPDIYGLHKDIELQYLYDMAKCVPDDGTIVEIGCLKGLSTIALLQGVGKRNVFVYSIDNFSHKVTTTKEEFLKNIKPYIKVRHELISLNSKDAVETFSDNSIDFLFIDGDHSFEGVKSDIELYWRKMKLPTSFMAGHDFRPHNDVWKAVHQWRKKAEIKFFRKIQGTSIWEIRKA